MDPNCHYFFGCESRQNVVCCESSVVSLKSSFFFCQIVYTQIRGAVHTVCLHAESACSTWRTYLRSLYDISDAFFRKTHW